MKLFSRKAKISTILRVSGMSCGACVAHVTKALEKVPGVQSASVDLANGRAEIEGAAENQALIEAVKTAGYEAEIV